MARLEIENADFAGLGANANADILFEMGLACATGRDGATDLVAAHKWFNIAAIKGSARAGALRAEIAETMSKAELAKALRDAREWMTRH
ncbi:MAG: sel1 repeat family protein [Roseitalea porphyridii]|uniref:sel1 repeat family protein n=1 Tax=Roseitalea porphyridii TaxID=1852022 RepID=UPI0032D9A22D